MNAKIKTLLIVTVLSLVVLSACDIRSRLPGLSLTGPDTVPAAVDPTQAAKDEAQNKAVEAARSTLAAQLNVEADTLDLITVEAVDWSDSCLGLGGPAESCLQATTPGFRVTFASGGQSYIFHTDLPAEVIRQETAETNG